MTDKGVHSYEHTVQYYETDAMRIVHHSNYFRWFEECRCDFLGNIGLSYDEMEAHGVIIPVLDINCQYKVAVEYGQKVRITAEMGTFTGLKFDVNYKVEDCETGVLHATGHSEHCFLSMDMKPISVRKVAPPIYEYFSQFKNKK